MVQVVQSWRQSSPSIEGRVRGKRASGARAVRMPSAGPDLVALGSEGVVVNLSFARRRKDVIAIFGWPRGQRCGRTRMALFWVAVGGVLSDDLIR